MLFLIVDMLYSQNVCIDPTILNHQPDGQSGVYMENYRWTTGKTIKVKFMGGQEIVRSRIKNAVLIWEQYANIKFEFVSEGIADIRIAFHPQKGAYSQIGNRAETIPQHIETMNFGWFTSSTDENEIKRTTLHEFGHALGLLHEHQNPLSPIKWNYPRAYAYYMQVQGWSKETVDFNIFNRYSVSQTNNTFDPGSIMIYPIPAELTLDGYAVQLNTDLSEKDKKLIADLYPRLTNPTTITSTPSTRGQANFSYINIEHNVIHGTEKGMLIKNIFSIKNMMNRNAKLVAYVYDNDGNRFTSPRSPGSNGVAVSTSFQPNYDYTVYENSQLFLPYSSLNLPNGYHKLKVALHIFDDQNNELANSGKYLFTYQSGPSCDQMLDLTVNTLSDKFVIYPTFKINYARNQPSKLSVYILYADGTPVPAKNGSPYRASDGRLVMSIPISPCCDKTFFNTGTTDSRFWINFPFSELPYRTGPTRYKLFVLVEDSSGEQYYQCSSNHMEFTVTNT